MGSYCISYEKPKSEKEATADKIKFTINGEQQELKFTLSVALQIEEKFDDVFTFLANLKSIKNSLFVLRLMINHKIREYNKTFNQKIEEVKEENILIFIDSEVGNAFDSLMFSQVVQDIVTKAQPQEKIKKN